jgi:hypothetical protein
MKAGREKGPLIIPDHDINDLWRRESNNEFMFDQFAKKGLVEFRLGDVVLVADNGPLNGRRGTISDKQNDNRYRVTLGNINITARGDQLSRL